MASGAERQRKRRERLRRQGIVDVTVSVPEARKGLLRDFARRLLTEDEEPSLTGGRLIDVIRALKDIRDELRERGIVHAGVFGSSARGRDTSESDVDVIVDIDEEKIGDILDMVGVAGRIEKAVQTRCPGVRVDVADLQMLKPRVRDKVEREAVYAF